MDSDRINAIAFSMGVKKIKDFVAVGAAALEGYLWLQVAFDSSCAVGA